MLPLNSELLRLFFQPFKNFSQKTRLKFTLFLSLKYWCLPLLCISIVIFQFDHHRFCFLRLLSTFCSSFTDRGCISSSHLNATYITFSLPAIYFNSLLASNFPYTRTI